MKRNKRQQLLVSFFEKKKFLSQKEIQNEFEKLGISPSKITVLRDIEILMHQGFLEKIGKGRATKYQVVGGEFFHPIDIEDYFKKGPDEREGVHEQFNFEIFEKLQNYPIFAKDEFFFLENLQEKYRKNVQNTDPTLIHKEFERFTIEFAWKSSQFEGNTYTLLETESLFTEGKEPFGHSKEESIMILNHKKAFDYIRSNTDQFLNLNIYEIENIHSLLTKDLPIVSGLRQRVVGITGTRYKPLDNIHQIREMLENLCRIVNVFSDVFSKALITLALISYIQPFNDGNKRTSRLISNALLLAYDNCPLSYRNVNESDYKKAMLLFYEKQNFFYLKKLFIKQLEFSVNTYFQ